MKMPNWRVISGLMAATAMMAQAEATNVDATARHTSEDGMDVIVVTARRPAALPDAEVVSVSTADAFGEIDAVATEGPVLGPSVGVRSRNEMFARVQEATQEAIENATISVEISGEPF